jgi:5-methylcytosine-specific restriction enzyme subunit McrC
MLYQLAIYALSQPGGIDAAILYPTLQSDAEEARIIIRDPVYSASTAHVILRPVNLHRLDELIASPKTAQLERERARFAGWLVFGT